MAAMTEMRELMVKYWCM